MARVRKQSRDLEMSFLKHLLYEVGAYTAGGIGLYLGFEKHYLFFLILPLAITFALFVRKRRAVIAGGLNGERSGRKVFKGLPKTYKVYQSVKLNNNGHRGEIDFLIVGKKNLFLIETKNLNGKIYGNVLEDYLFKEKLVQGKAVRDKIKNPANQVKRTKKILSKSLNDSRIRIVPIILSIHPKGVWDIEFDNVSIEFEATINQSILDFEQRLDTDLDFQKNVIEKIKHGL